MTTVRTRSTTRTASRETSFFPYALITLCSAVLCCALLCSAVLQAPRAGLLPAGRGTVPLGAAGLGRGAAPKVAVSSAEASHASLPIGGAAGDGAPLPQARAVHPDPAPAA